MADPAIGHRQSPITDYRFQIMDYRFPMKEISGLTSTLLNL
jgi:hypothetical protein